MSTPSADALTDIKQRAGILKDVSISATGDGSDDAAHNKINLGTDIVYGITQAYKNGSEIEEDTDYTWNTYQPRIETIQDVETGDHFLITIQTTFSDETITKEYENWFDEYVNELFAYFDDVTELKNSPTLERLVKLKTISLLLQQQVQGPALESSTYRRGVNHDEHVRDILRLIKKGGQPLLDATDEALDRADGSLVTGASVHTDDLTDRGDVLDKLEEWDDSIQDITRDT